MAAQHISIHIDNYLIDSNISNEKGQRNLELLLTADVLYFSGGDQARHIRSWLNNDGSPNDLLKVVK
jgi:cyanophycinase-like exopeptidase